MTSATDAPPAASDAEEAAIEAMRAEVRGAWQQIVGKIRAENASDVGLSPAESKGAGTQVWMRINGANRRAMNFPSIPVMWMLEYPFGTRPQILQELSQPGAMPEIDTAEVVLGQRFRFNVVKTYDGISAALRPLSDRIPTFKELGIDRRLIDHILSAKNGIVLVAGQTGSGKTTTIAAILNQINEEVPGKIVSTEDPIEYVLEPKQCQIEAREVGTHTTSFGASLRSNMRQNPDYIMAGELRDEASISAALEAAETGHVVFATVHAGSVTEVPNRMISKLPPAAQATAREKLGYTTIAVVAQKLLAKRGRGRVCWRETLLADTTARVLIQGGKDNELNTQMLTGLKTGSCPYFKHWEEIQHDLAQQEIDKWMPFVKKGAGI